MDEIEQLERRAPARVVVSAERELREARARLEMLRMTIKRTLYADNIIEDDKENVESNYETGFASNLSGETSEQEAVGDTAQHNCGNSSSVNLIIPKPSSHPASETADGTMQFVSLSGETLTRKNSYEDVSSMIGVTGSTGIATDFANEEINELLRKKGKEIDKLLHKVGAMLDGKEIEVMECGIREVNGRYHRFGTRDNVPVYAKIGTLEGREVMFNVSRWQCTNGTRKWYITANVPDNSQGMQLVFYVAYAPSSLTTPPRRSWMAVVEGGELFLSPEYKGRGINPVPVIVLGYDEDTHSNGNDLGMQISRAISTSVSSNKRSHEHDWRSTASLISRGSLLSLGSVSTRTSRRHKSSISEIAFTSSLSGETAKLKAVGDTAQHIYGNNNSANLITQQLSSPPASEIADSTMQMVSLSGETSKRKDSYEDVLSMLEVTGSTGMVTNFADEEINKLLQKVGKEIDKLLYEVGTILDVKEIEVSGCGIQELNGRYHRFGTHDDVPGYAQTGTFEGKDVMFNVRRWQCTNGTRKWYITANVPDNSQGMQLVFYVAYAPSSFTMPPRRSWMAVVEGEELFLSPKYKGRGIDPAPVIVLGPDEDTCTSGNDLGMQIIRAISTSVSSRNGCHENDRRSRGSVMSGEI
jgi:hypothetical protein